MKLTSVIFYYILILIFSGCSIQKKAIENGFLIYKFRQYDSISHEYALPTIFSDRQLWYKNKSVIQEIYSTIHKSDTFGIKTTEKRFQYYLFIDRQSKSFYHYSSFSDTAKILDSYTQSDTSELGKKGGWRFYAPDDIIDYSDLSYLSDTTMNGIVLKRIRFIEHINNFKINTVGYLRCDKKGTMFQIGKNITQITGCPMVRYEQLPSSGIIYLTSDEIVFERDSLTKEELKVFNAWEKNLQKYPINK